MTASFEYKCYGSDSPCAKKSENVQFITFFPREQETLGIH